MIVDCCCVDCGGLVSIVWLCGRESIRDTWAQMMIRQWSAPITVHYIRSRDGVMCDGSLMCPFTYH
eukprot:scaffold56014_cov30-Tisochrysis_lutea.AAC.1